MDHDRHSEGVEVATFVLIHGAATSARCEQCQVNRGELVFGGCLFMSAADVGLLRRLQAMTR